jgi:DNA polymerase elongation subunit (family B)
MNFKLTKIDPYNCPIEELKQEIEKLSDLQLQQYGSEQSLKILANSIYGGLANQ